MGLIGEDYIENMIVWEWMLFMVFMDVFVVLYVL